MHSTANMDKFVQSTALLSSAIRLFDNHQFQSAGERVHEYLQSMDYKLVPFQDDRIKRKILVSIIISSIGMDHGFIECMASVSRQTDQDFEIIIADHSGSEKKEPAYESVLTLSLPRNFSLPEGRNIGAHFSKGEYLVFMTSHHLIHPDFIGNMKKAWSVFDFVALTGKIVSGTGVLDSSDRFRFDQRAYPVPVPRIVQGHLVIKKQVFERVGNFNPLFTKGDLIEWNLRCQRQFPGMTYYWPSLMIAGDDALDQTKADRLQGAEKAFDDLRRGEQDNEHAGDCYELFYCQTLARRLQIQLDDIRRSVPFQLVHAVRDAVQSPRTHGLEVIRLLTGLLKNRLTKRKINGKRESNVFLRNQKKYIRPGAQEHIFTRFKRFTALKSTENKSLRIACILSPHLHDCLKFEADLIPLDPYDWKRQLDTEQPHMIVVQSTWDFHSTGWENLFSGDKDLEQTLQAIVNQGKKRNLPTIFWDTEYRDHYSIFSGIAGCFDFVMATDPENFEQYRGMKDSDHIIHQPLAVQPALHNPVLPGHLSLPDRDFSILFDGWADILEWPDRFQFLKDLFPAGLHIAESRYRYAANKLDDLPEFREHIMGYLADQTRLTALRSYRIYLMSSDSLSSPLSLANRAMEAAACGCTVIYKGSENQFIPEKIVTYTASDQETVLQCRMYLEKESEASISGLETRRKLFGRHSYAHGLRRICGKLGLDYDWEEYPKISMITPSKRPEQFFKALENFKRQDYPNKEWIFLMNSSQKPTDSMIKICQDDPNIRIFQLHEEKNIGICLNFGIKKATGKYWFKIDDDDLYGPNYILDMMMEMRGIDADIFGKPPGFVYLAQTDELLLRNKGVNSQYVLGRYDAPDICGATISGKKRKGRQIEFSENMRACVDSDYLSMCKGAGLTIYLSSVWGFCAIRGENRGGHTWKADHMELKKSATCFGNKDELKKIMR